MKKHTVRAYSAGEELLQREELAYKFATLAKDGASLDDAAVEMVKNRIIDNASVAIAAINDSPVRVAREMALCHPARPGKGAAVMGVPTTTLVSAEWAAWANGTAVRQLDYHDTFLAQDYSHPADNIPPILAVAQSLHEHSDKLIGEKLLQGILTAYEIQVALVKSISLHKHAIDHIAHLGVSMAAGMGTLLDLPHEVIYQAIQQALHVTINTRQSRKARISSWKSFAPAHAGKLSVEAIDRCMRGEGAPSPIYEGEDSVIAQILDGIGKHYEISLPSPGEPLTGILETYTKEHSAEYQSQAIIDLAFEIRETVDNLEEIESIVIHTSHHTHKVIGTGSGDPQKFDPDTSRETLDHSIMYIFAVALEDKVWHHIDSYTSERAHRPSTVTLWNKISTREDKVWTERYHDSNPEKKAFGARIEVVFKNGDVKNFEKAIANAHFSGRRPFQREQYIHKFKTLTSPLLSPAEQERFLETVLRLEKLRVNELMNLNIVIAPEKLEKSSKPMGLF